MKKLTILLFAVAVLAACAPPTIVETVVVTEVPVEVTEIVEKPVEVVVTPTPKEVPVTPTPVPGGEQWAIGLAEEIIAQEYPQFVGAERRTTSASVKGRYFWVVTHLQTVQVEGRTGPVDLTLSLVISVDRNTGEISVAESD